MSFIKGKRGDAADIGWPQLVFIVLVIAFIGMFFVFVKNSLSGTLIQEEVYAKKIALMIDSARPGTVITLDLREINKLSEGKVDSSRIVDLSEIGYVKVSLRSSNGYKYSYFSDYNVVGTYDDAGGNPKYIVGIGEKK